MSMVINTNVASLTSQRLLSNTTNSLKTSMERLSSGLRVNSAKDDAAGLAISDGMTSQIRGMTVAIRNANDGISMAQTAESAMGSITETMQRMRDLAVQASNFGAVSSSDREKLQTEFKQLGDEIGRIIKNTEFNGKKVLNGSLQNVNFQVGAGTSANNQISINVSDLATASGIQSLFSTNAVSIGSGAASADTRNAIDAIDNAIKKIDNFRSTLGAIQNRFTTTIGNLQSSIENQSAARSRIMDADFASETSNLSRTQILQQAGTAMLAQANQSSQTVLSLLR
ncbi:MULTISPECIES: flagellin [Methylomonas]|uniref:Flagellin n=1 Tax=Methylomonas koyamae TaxID=702114 RepID=A0A291INK1_9GAMM|nr:MULTISPECIES: flagellin [Methylomonas]ANE56792.1 flagellin [Methylomonas sp. DH-1]ATG91737.1 flagellin [Methylomonas koyamae]OAI27717.1 flagellin [Methylomonas koyamae]WNB75175.1 flagellin [Methylomonas koyamae]BBL59950.1 flagellin [Methylomonas koyamae]